jgi:hypothetical protein
MKTVIPTHTQHLAVVIRAKRMLPLLQEEHAMRMALSDATKLADEATNHHHHHHPGAAAAAAPADGAAANSKSPKVLWGEVRALLREADGMCKEQQSVPPAESSSSPGVEGERPPLPFQGMSGERGERGDDSVAKVNRSPEYASAKEGLKRWCGGRIAACGRGALARGRHRRMRRAIAEIERLMGELERAEEEDQQREAERQEQVGR